LLTSRCLQNQAAIEFSSKFWLPCIRNASIWSQVFLRVGYRIGSRKPSPKSVCAAVFVIPFGFICTFIWMIERLETDSISTHSKVKQAVRKSDKDQTSNTALT
jgi:hypothetical protein